MTTLVVEDGTIVTGANSYISLVDAQTYWATWGYDSGMIGTDTIAQTAALYYAAYSMERLYGRLYIGDVMNHSPQLMLWPRQGLYHRGRHAPYISVNDTTGNGARFAVRVVDGVVTNIYIVNGGAGYTAPTLQVNDGSGSGATITAAITSGVITSVTLTAGGFGYATPIDLTNNDGMQIANDVIPQALKDAQCEMAVLSLQGCDLFPQESDERILKTEIEKIANQLNFTREYFPDSSTDIERYEGFRKIELILWSISNKRTVYL